MTLKVLVLGKDQQLFCVGRENAIGDTRARHSFYAQRLRERFPGSELRVITYTERICQTDYAELDSGLIVYGTRSRHRILYLIGLVLTFRRIVASGWRPDVITSQEPWEEGLAAMCLAWSIGARAIPQLHFDIFSPQWLSERLSNRVRKAIARFVLQQAHSVRVVSTALRDKVAENWRIPKRRIWIAPVGVDFRRVEGDKESFKSQLLTTTNARDVVLFVGRLVSQKNLLLWIGVAEAVRRRRHEVTFVIIGNGPMETVIRAQVAALELEDSVLFLGARRHADLPEIFAAADVFLLTSHYEGFGRVILEAMLASVPVVSTVCCGPEDLIVDGTTGFLCRCGDQRGLAEAVLKLLEDRQLAQRMGACGYRRATAQFRLETLADRLIDGWMSEA